MTSPAFDQIDSWLIRARASVQKQGVTIELRHSRPEMSPGPVVLDISSTSGDGQIIIWDDGQAQLSAGRTGETVDLLDEYCADIDQFGLDRALELVLKRTA